MTGGIWITRFDRRNHKLQQFPIGALELPINLVYLPQSEKRYGKHKRAHNAVLRVNPNEKENDRQGEEIVWQNAECILTPNCPRISRIDDAQCSAHADRIGNEKDKEEGKQRQRTGF